MLFFDVVTWIVISLDTKCFYGVKNIGCDLFGAHINFYRYLYFKDNFIISESI
eukprot:SAG11_NODE_151_length_14583_cov_21.306200_2_plen_53_part_00